MEWLDQYAQDGNEHLKVFFFFFNNSQTKGILSDIFIDIQRAKISVIVSIFEVFEFFNMALIAFLFHHSEQICQKRDF